MFSIEKRYRRFTPHSTMASKGYCVKCKKKVTIKDGKTVVWKNGMKALSGKCPNCDIGVNLILGKA